MKNMKKMMALLFAMILVFSMGANAFAASIEITHDETYDEYVDPDSSDARVYVAYKVFDASYTQLEGENTQADKDDFTYTPADAAVSYSMKANNPWVPVMKAAGQTWFDVKEDANGNYVVTPKDGAYEDAEDALDFAEYLQENIPAGATGTEVTVDADAVTVDPGYYLITAKDDKDAVTRVALVTTDVTMVEKNTYIDTTKTVAKTNYKIGDTVSYTATVKIPADTALTIADSGSATGYKAGHGPIIIHDTMDSTLTFKEDVAADKGSFIASYDETEGWDPADGCTFELKIPVTEALLGQTITLTYTAEVNSTAATATGLVNELGAELNGYKTVPDKPMVYTFGFHFKKIFDKSTDQNLTATFELHDADDAVIKLTKISDTLYSVKDSDDTEVTGDLITIKNGQEIEIKGLDAGTYYLVEKSTSTGYNLIDEPSEVEIIDETDPGADKVVQQAEIKYSIKVDGEALGKDVYTFDVTNYTGTVLPSTGGMGTTLFYVIGSVLVIGAVVLLVSKRRMSDR